VFVVFCGVLRVFCGVLRVFCSISTKHTTPKKYRKTLENTKNSQYARVLLVAELWLRLRLAAAPLLCWLNACCGLWMMACAVPALLTHDP